MSDIEKEIVECEKQLSALRLAQHRQKLEEMKTKHEKKMQEHYAYMETHRKYYKEYRKKYTSLASLIDQYEKGDLGKK